MSRPVLGIVIAIALFSGGGLLGAIAHREGWHHVLRGEEPEPPPKKKPGWPNFGAVPTEAQGAAPDDDLRAQLQAIGYLEGYEEGPSGRAAVVSGLAQPGLTLHTTGSGPEALLTRLDGSVVHRWRYDDPEADPEMKQFWRIARLGADGELFAILDYGTLYKLDVDSNLQWRFDELAHHDLDISEDGRIWVLTQALREHPAFPGQQVFDNDIAVLSPDGTVLHRISILDAFFESDFAGLLGRTRELPDVLHANKVTVLDGRLAGRLPAFRAGNLMISLRRLDTVAVIDIETERVVWALAGLWVEQHDPTLVDPGHLLVFDNYGRNGRSRSIEVDPVTQEVVWVYPEDADHPLHAVAMGATRRLPNGNTLIVESPRGHALEVTRDGQTVWEFWNPERAGAEGEFIATLPHMERLPPETGAGWLRPE